MDTREITRRLRDTGALNGIITTDMTTPAEELVEKSKSWSILGKVPCHHAQHLPYLRLYPGIPQQTAFHVAGPLHTTSLKRHTSREHERSCPTGASAVELVVEEYDSAAHECV